MNFCEWASRPKEIEYFKNRWYFILWNHRDIPEFVIKNVSHSAIAIIPIKIHNSINTNLGLITNSWFSIKFKIICSYYIVEINFRLKRVNDRLPIFYFKSKSVSRRSHFSINNWIIRVKCPLIRNSAHFNNISEIRFQIRP